MFAALVAAGFTFYFVPGILLWITAGYDAYRVARQVNVGSLPFVPVNFGMLFLHVIVFGGLQYYLFMTYSVGFFPFHG